MGMIGPEPRTDCVWSKPLSTIATASRTSASAPSTVAVTGDASWKRSFASAGPCPPAWIVVTDVTLRPDRSEIVTAAYDCRAAHRLRCPVGGVPGTLRRRADDGRGGLARRGGMVQVR